MKSGGRFCHGYGHHLDGAEHRQAGLDAVREDFEEPWLRGYYDIRGTPEWKRLRA